MPGGGGVLACLGVLVCLLAWLWCSLMLHTLRQRVRLRIQPFFSPQCEECIPQCMLQQHKNAACLLTSMRPRSACPSRRPVSGSCVCLWNW